MKKKIFWGSCLVILVAAVVVCCVRWKAWFQNPPEPAYTVTEAPQNVVLCVGWNGDADRTVTWRTRDSLPSWIYLESMDDKGKLILDSSEVKPPHLVCTRGGRAYYYCCRITNLLLGAHRYWIKCGKYTTEKYSFTVARPDTLRFAVFGDIQESEVPNPFSEFVRRTDLQKYAFMGYVGDVVERPIDALWQVWFQSMNGQQAQVAQAPAVGNHEYLKGVIKHIDNRWSSVFTMPNNGPERFCGAAYFVDYKNLRMIYLNTEELQSPMDYHSARTWLSWVLGTSLGKWRVVVMHHPVYSSAKGRQNYLVRRLFRGRLQEADVIIAGHDHNYARREGVHDLYGGNTDGVYSAAAARMHPSIYIETVSCGCKFYEGETHREDVCFLSHTPVYEDITVTENTLNLQTRNLKTGALVDELNLRH